ncbi:hypothetical protein [uncultured Endozoicomonas sp.]|uniref:hypothetical protein n=1 Tax=uncultured Endozoicomonas sp. TaxID=432652 RepID=UPI002620D9C5|nr:hypothetical protein [uncultured Endozoicomonas sp.]
MDTSLVANRQSNPLTLPSPQNSQSSTAFNRPTKHFIPSIYLPDQTATKTDIHRLLGLNGLDGTHACRLADGWQTIPRISWTGRVTAASRDILRLKNIQIFRGEPLSSGLEKCMIGPNHYLGVLDDTHTYTCKLISTNNTLQFINTNSEPEQTLPDQKPNSHHILTIGAKWISGKKTENRPFIQEQLNLTDNDQRQSLTKDIGVLIVDKSQLTLPKFDATNIDLSCFGAKLVRNDQPFKITQIKEDPLDVVTYHFGSEYAEMTVKEKNGLFLETHDFTQIMSPMTKDSSGFITLGKWQDSSQKMLDLIGVTVPYGYSIIVTKGAIHGDATFVGCYLMGMTVDHNTMATADVLHLKDQFKNNVMLKLTSSATPSENRQPLEVPHTTGNISRSFLDNNVRPLVLVNGGELKPYFDKICWKEIELLKGKRGALTSIVFNPLNNGWKVMSELCLKQWLSNYFSH